MEVYCLEVRKVQDRGDIILGWRWVLRYKVIWNLFMLLILVIRAPFEANFLLERNWCIVVPNGVLLLPECLKGE